MVAIGTRPAPEALQVVLHCRHAEAQAPREAGVRRPYNGRLTGCAPVRRLRRPEELVDQREYGGLQAIAAAARLATEAPPCGSRQDLSFAVGGANLYALSVSDEDLRRPCLRIHAHLPCSGRRRHCDNKRRTSFWARFIVRRPSDVVRCSKTFLASLRQENPLAEWRLVPKDS